MIKTINLFRKCRCYHEKINHFIPGYFISSLTISMLTDRIHKIVAKKTKRCPFILTVSYRAF